MQGMLGTLQKKKIQNFYFMQKRKHYLIKNSSLLSLKELIKNGFLNAG